MPFVGPTEAASATSPSLLAYVTVISSPEAVIEVIALFAAIMEVLFPAALVAIALAESPANAKT